MYWWIPNNDGRPPAFVAYDVVEDRWRELPVPHDVGGHRWLHLVAADDVIVGYHATHEAGGNDPDQVSDPALQAWRELPRDPLAPSFDRSMVWTGDELVLLALDLVDNPGSKKPSLYRAATLDMASRSWRRLPESEIVGDSPWWVSVGSLVINPSTGGADGGETNGWGRWYPSGGILDVDAGSWSRLPPPPLDVPRWVYTLVGGDGFVFSGLLSDVSTRSWTVVEGPPDGTDLEQAVAIGDGQLFVWGGVTEEGQESSADGWTMSLAPPP
ncbi:hypothetical protein BH23ACT10_BH23ACT10_04660 [soil metagenome]